MSGGFRLLWALASLMLVGTVISSADPSDSSGSDSFRPDSSASDPSSANSSNQPKSSPEQAAPSSGQSTASAPSPSATAPAGPPMAEKRPLEETFHGIKVLDNHRALEKNTPPAQKWVEEEMSYTRSLLDPLPGRTQIHQRLTELLSIGNIGVPQLEGRHYFYTRRDGMQNQPVLYVREGVGGKDRVLVDANQLAADGTVALDWFQASENGKYAAYGTSARGPATNHLQRNKTTPAHPRPLLYHPPGTRPDPAQPIFGEGRDLEDWPSVNLDNDGRLLLITVSQGWTKTELFLMDLKKGTPPTRITTNKNFLYRATAYNGRLYIVTNEDAPRYRVFMAEAGNYERDDWKEIIPQTGSVLQNIGLWGDKIVAQYEQNASSQLKIFESDGTSVKNLALPAIGTVWDLSGKWNRDEIFYGFQSFTFAPSIYRYDLKTGATSLWAKVDAPSIDPAAYDVQQEWFNSKDGTRVPMFIVHKKGLKKDGDNPPLLTGYGGLNISNPPAFRPATYLWLEHGGVYAVANLRGGAEFGEDWHRAGMLGKKQNVFDDMIAAAEHLIAAKYTDKNHLAIQGGSNGGLLMGAMITQRPDLFRAGVCQVPLSDMLRYRNFQIAKLR